MYRAAAAEEPAVKSIDACIGPQKKENVVMEPKKEAHDLLEFPITLINAPSSLAPEGPGPFGEGDGLDGDCTRAD